MKQKIDTIRGLVDKYGWCLCGSPVNTLKWLAAYLREGIDWKEREEMIAANPSKAREVMNMLLDGSGLCSHGTTISSVWVWESSEQDALNLISQMTDEELDQVLEAEWQPPD